MKTKLIIILLFLLPLNNLLFGQIDTLYFEDFTNPLPNNLFPGWTVGDGPQLYEQDTIYSSDTSWGYYYDQFGLKSLGGGTNFNVPISEDTTLSLATYINDSSAAYLLIKGGFGLGYAFGDTFKIIGYFNEQPTLLNYFVDSYSNSPDCVLVDMPINNYLLPNNLNKVQLKFIISQHTDGLGAFVNTILIYRPSVSDLRLNSFDYLLSCSGDSFFVRCDYENVSQDTITSYIAKFGVSGVWLDTDTVSLFLPPGTRGQHTFGPYPTSILPGTNITTNIDFLASGPKGNDSNNGNDSITITKFFAIEQIDTLNSLVETFENVPNWNLNNSFGYDSTGNIWKNKDGHKYVWRILQRNYAVAPYYSMLFDGDAPANGDHTKYNQPLGKFAWLNIRYDSSGRDNSLSTYPTDTTYLYTNWLNLTNAVSPEISYWYYIYGGVPDFKLSLQAWNCNTKSWETLKEYSQRTHNSYTEPWKNERISLAQYAGATTRLRFVFEKTATSSAYFDTLFVGLDDIAVKDTLQPELYVKNHTLFNNECYSSNDSIGVIIGNNSNVVFSDSLEIILTVKHNNQTVANISAKDSLYITKTKDDTLIIKGIDFSQPGNYYVSIHINNYSDADTANNYYAYRFAKLSTDSAYKFISCDFDTLNLYFNIKDYYPAWNEGEKETSTLDSLYKDLNLQYKSHPNDSPTNKSAVYMSGGRIITTPYVQITDSGSYLSYKYQLNDTIPGAKFQVLYSENCGKSWQLLREYTTGSNSWQYDTLYLDSLNQKQIHFGFASVYSGTTSDYIIYLDSINLFQKYNDLSVISIESKTLCWGEDTVRVHYKNTGYYPVNDSITIALDVANQNYIRKKLSQLSPNDSDSVSFAVNLPKDATTKYLAVAKLFWQQDEDTTNNTINDSLTKHQPYSVANTNFLPQDTVNYGDTLLLTSGLSGYYESAVWFKDSSVIGTGDSVQFISDTTGSVAIMLQVIGCNDTTLYKDSTFVVSSFRKYVLPGIKIYPNPTHDYLRITSPYYLHGYELYGSDGKLLQKVSINGNSYDIDLTPYTSGTYLLILRTRAGIGVYRIVKSD